MIIGIKRCAIKLCLIFVLLLCISSWFTISASAYTKETINSEKAAEINSAISGEQMISTIRYSNAGNTSAYNPSSDTNGTPGENLIINGNFESNPSNNGKWNAVYDKTKEIPVFTWDDQTYHGTSGRSLRIKGNNVNGSIVNKVDIKPGNTYSFSAFGKGLDIAASGGSIIFIGQYDKNDKLIPGTDNFFIQDGTFEWQIVNVKFVANPNASSVKIDLMLDGSGTAWFDDISLINTGVIPGSSSKVVVNAGINKTTYKGFKVNLDGSKSFAKDGSSLTYNWSFESQPVGSTSNLSDDDIANPYFIPDIVGDYNLSLTVKDSNGNSDTKKVTIRAKQFSDTSDDGNFNSIDRLTQKFLQGYSFYDFIPLSDGWLIIGDLGKKQIVILNTLTGEVAKSYQLQERPDQIDFDFDKGIIVATQSTTNNIAKIDVNSDNVSYITATSNTIIDGNSDIAIGKDNIVFFLRNRYPSSWVGILDISQNIEVGHTDISSENLHFMAFNQVNDELILGEGGSSICSLLRYTYDGQKYIISKVQKVEDLGGNGKDLSISNDGKHIVFCNGGGNKGGKTIFDIDSNDISKKFGEWKTGASYAVFSYDNKYLLTADSSEIILFSVDNYAPIKKIGSNIWSDVYNLGISRGGRIGYVKTDRGICTFRIDDSSFLPLNIESISTDKETPQIESTNISVTANTSGGTNYKLYNFIVYDGNQWITQQEYSTSNTFDWKPEAAGEYYLVVEAKDADSYNDYDVYNTIRYNITEEPASITISGPSNCTITSGAGITLEYSASVEDNEGSILPKQIVSWSIDGQVAGVQIDDSTGVVTVDSTAQPGTFSIIAKAGKVSVTITVTIEKNTIKPSSILISGADKIEIPLNGTATSKYSAVVKDQNGKSMLEELVDWVIYDSAHKPISGLSISNTGLISVNSTAVPNTYIVEARSNTNTSVCNIKTILLTKSAPQLTGFTWAQGSTVGTTKATVVPTGTLKYIVGAAGSQLQPNLGDAATAYINTLSANADIAVTAGQHIYIVETGNDGTITGWADINVDGKNIKQAPIAAYILTGFTWAQGSTTGTTKAIAVPAGILKYIVGAEGSQVRPNVGDAIAAYTNSLIVNANIAVSEGQHIFVVKVGSDGTITSWADIAVNTAKIRPVTTAAPQLTGFIWEQGSKTGTTKATVVPAGTLKYIVGVAGSQVRPNVGDETAAYTNGLTVNADIAVSEEKHIFVVKVGNDGTITDWADIAVNTANIKPLPAEPILTGLNWERASTSGTTTATLVPFGTIKNPNQEQPNNGTWEIFCDYTKKASVFAWDNQTYYGTSGNSLRIEGDNVKGLIVNKVDIKPGNTYSFSASGKGLDIAASGGASVFIGQYDKNDKLIPETGNFFIEYGTFEWQIASVKFVANPNASSVKIYLMLDGSGTAWFDNISLINTGVIPGSSSKVVANTGINKTTYKGFKVILDGSKSFAKDGSLLTYNWFFESQPVGSTSTLTDADTANPYFIPDIAGDYILSLTVKDNNGNSDTKKVTIRAKQFSDTSDDDNFNSISRLAQNILTGYTFEDFIPLSDGWVIFGDTIKKQIIILNTLTGEVAKSYQLQEAPDRIDFDFDKGIIVTTQSTTNNIAKVDVYSDNVSYITTTPYTGNGVDVGLSRIRDITIGKNNIVFYLRNKWVGSLVGILDISQNTEFGYAHVNDGQLISFNQINNEIIIGDRGSTPSVLHRYKYNDQDNSLSLLQITRDLGANGIDLAISNDGKHIAFCCGSGNGNGYSIFDIDSSDLSKNFGEWDTDGYPTSADFSYDNKYLLATNGSDVKLFSVDNHTLIKTVSPGISLDICKVRISRGGRLVYAYAYTYTRGWELYTFRIDDSSLLPLNISTDKESPQIESTNISVMANTSGGTDGRFYCFNVYDGNQWISHQEYSTSSTFNWKPEVAGEYYLVIEAKDEDSFNDYDVYNTIRYNITKEPASITISGPRDYTITSGVDIRIGYSASVEDIEGNILPEQKVSWSIDGQVAGVQIDGSTGVVTVDSTAQPGTFVIIAKVGDVSDTITVTIEKNKIKPSAILISGAEKIEIPLSGAITSEYTAVVKDLDGNPIPEELVDWGIYDSEHKPVSGLSISNTGLITVDSSVAPNTYIIEARSITNTSVYSTKTILLTTHQAISAPQLTGFTWAQGNTSGTTKATVVPAGTLNYIVGTAGSQVQPNVGDAATAYTNILTANTDIVVSAGQHIFIVGVGNDGNIASWADVAVSESNINLGRIQGDVNNDSVVDALDFALMKIYLLGGTANINKINSDINLDGEINAIDFALLKMQLLN